jgi:hypothetical protein
VDWGGGDAREGAVVEGRRKGVPTISIEVTQNLVEKTACWRRRGEAGDFKSYAPVKIEASDVTRLSRRARRK